MNVLVTVFTILMMVAALTYARMESFLDFNSMHTVQREYMRGTERKVYNAAQLKLYHDEPSQVEKVKDKDKEKPSENAQAEKPDEKIEEPKDINYYNENAEAIQEEMFETAQKKEHLLSYIDWNVLVNMDELENKELFDKTYTLSKQLILLLYSNHPFFIEAKQKYPNLEELILNKIIEAGKKLREEEKDKKDKTLKIKRKKQLAEIAFAQEDLRQVYYKMVKGTRGKKERQLIGYPPLLDFVTISTNRPISIYLAPYEILVCIFQSPEVAQQLVEERLEIYHTISNGALNLQEAEQRLQTEFEGKVPSELRGTFITFKTSKTNPTGYK